MRENEVSFGAAIKKRREAINLSQEKLAALTGCALSTIARLENESLRPSRQLAEILAIRLQIPVNERSAFVALGRSILTLGAPPASPADVLTDESPNTNLPMQLGSLLGRDEELAACSALLRDKETRLLALTGAAGVGKTSLALEVADSLLPDFPEGVFFMPLAFASDAQLALQSIAHTLGVSEPAGATLANLIADLADKKLLLLLDHVDHMPGLSAPLADLLAGAPRVKILLTSQATLDTENSCVFELAPLAPTPAAQLFAAATPHSTIDGDNAAAVNELCASLAGLPLALQLVAARADEFAVSQLLGSIKTSVPDDPAQVLQAALNWTCGLLAPEELYLLKRLAVFAGGCTLAALEAIVAGAPDQQRVKLSAILDELLARKLVYQKSSVESATRFMLPDAAQEYVLSQLSAAEAKAIREQHAKYYLELVEAGAPNLTGARRGDLLDQLEADYDNIRAALSWRLADPDTSSFALRMVDALYGFWFFSGRVSEGRGWLDKALASAPATEVSPARARALSGSGLLAFVGADSDLALARLAESMLLFNQLDEKRSWGFALSYLSAVSVDMGQQEQALSLAQQSLLAFNDLDDDWGRALALHSLSVATQAALLASGSVESADKQYSQQSLELYNALGDYWGVGLGLITLNWLERPVAIPHPARALFADSLAHFSGIRDSYGLISSMLALAETARSEGNYAAATSRYEQVLALSQRLDYTPVIARVLHTLGYMKLVAGDVVAARELCEQSLALARAEGLQETAAWALRNLAFLATLGADPAQAAQYYAEAARLFSAVGARMGQALCLVDLASAGDIAADPARAARLIGAADALIEFYHFHFDEADRLRYTNLVAAVRELLGPDDFATAYNVGSATPLDVSLAQALAP